MTGASGGVGAGIVRRVGRAGARLVIHYRSGRKAADRLASWVTGRGGEAVTVQADLTDPRGPEQIVEAAIVAFGRLDGLVNNAGIQPSAELIGLGEDDWREMLDVNLTAAHRCTQEAAGVMEEGGSIVHVASIEAHHPGWGHGHYAVSKAGLVVHARAAAAELGARGIRINVVSPGLITRPDIDAEWPEGVRRWRAVAPLRRLGEPEDVGDACVFLLSDLARWITGTELVVDGGMGTRPPWS